MIKREQFLRNSKTVIDLSLLTLEQFKIDSACFIKAVQFICTNNSRNKSKTIMQLLPSTVISSNQHHRVQTVQAFHHMVDV